MSKESKIHPCYQSSSACEDYIHLPFLNRKSQGPGTRNSPPCPADGRKEWETHVDREFMETQLCSLMMHSLRQKVLALGPNARKFLCTLHLINWMKHSNPANVELQIELKTSQFQKRLRLPSPSAGDSIPWKFQTNKRKTYLKLISPPTTC